MADADPETLGGYEARLDTDDERELLRSTRWPAWRHGEFWADHLKAQAHRADHLVTVSPQNRDAAIAVLGFAPDDVTALPNGVDIERFQPRDREARRAPGRVPPLPPRRPAGVVARAAAPGAVAYAESDLERLLGPDDDATVLLLVGRFLGFKRMPGLVRAFARARARFERPASLVVWGGHPGEWEGEHPFTVAEEVGSDGIFFTGWRGHEDLPEGLAMCDVLVVPSVRTRTRRCRWRRWRSACRCSRARAVGSRSMVNLDPQRPTGWFVPPDDGDAMTAGAGHGGQRPGRGRGAGARTRSNTPGPTSRGTDWCRASRRCTPRGSPGAGSGRRRRRRGSG